jgi:acetyl-CoA carboxylase biotin carboxyl carrier protein
VTDEIAERAPATGGDEPADGLAALTDDVLPALIARLRASRLGELEVRTGEWRIRLRRDPMAAARRSAASTSTPTPTPGTDAPPELSGSVARSTAVGYFTPSRELVVGGMVQAGDVMGVVDVLGIAQEVTAPEDGIIASVLAEEGQAVEYGQALAEIDPLELGLDGGEDLA